MIIGITGKKFHGKDTVAKHLIRILFDRQPEVLSFASPIKDIVSDMYSIPRMYMDMVELKELPIERLGGKSIRQLLQEYGTDVARRDNPNIWVNKMEEKLDKCSYAIITDCRFDNEAEMIKRRGGFIIHVDASIRVGGNDSHSSEKGVSGNLIDFTLDNNGTEEDLRDCLRVIVTSSLV